MPGSLVLVAGDPGIGKSTLLLQAASAFAQQNGPVLYVSGEESPRQVKMRGSRLGPLSSQVLVLAETQIDVIEHHLESLQPSLAVIDSVQTMYDTELESLPGTVSQVRQCAGRLMQVAKATGLPIFLVGHVTKEGSIAGPRLLEHMVDTVLYLEGDHHLNYRILRAAKNRFGSTNELGIFEMREKGLTEVSNPSQVFLSERQERVPGSVVVAIMEGSRPFLVEVQALVSKAPPFGAPRRTSTGVDYRRTCLILAVLEKREGLGLATQDVYVNLPGGVKVAEPAADLGIALAVASSFRESPVAPDTVYFGEIGLTGEVRGVSSPERRVEEASRLGFRRCVLPAHNLQDLAGKDIEAIPVSNLPQTFKVAWQR